MPANLIETVNAIEKAWTERTFLQSCSLDAIKEGDHGNTPALEAAILSFLDQSQDWNSEEARKLKRQLKDYLYQSCS